MNDKIRPEDFGHYRNRKDYFFPPHGGRPPTDEVVKEITRRYVEEERCRPDPAGGAQARIPAPEPTTAQPRTGTARRS